ncbi:hypothetical protein HRG_014633 [Hirsutella rhossiliensis]
MADITREYEELQAKQTRLQTRQEIRMHLKRVRGEMQKIREDYKVGKKQLVNGRVKTLNFKPWLEFTDETGARSDPTSPTYRYVVVARQ